MKTCEVCNKEFECAADYSCWCMKLPIKAFDTSATDCLCPDCLKDIIHDKKIRRTV